MARFTAKSITSTLTNAESVLSFNRLFSRRRIISTGLPSSLHILVGVQNAGHGRRGRVGERGQFIDLRKKNHAPLESNTSMHSHSLHYTTAPQREGCRRPCPGAHLTLEALGVDVEVAGRALAVVGGGEAGELLHRPPRRGVIVGRGGADDEEESEEDEARRGVRLRRHASLFGWLLCWVRWNREGYLPTSGG